MDPEAIAEWNLRRGGFRPAGGDKEATMAKQVVLYTQPGWGSCEQEKEFLSRKGVQFVAKDIRADTGARDELIKLGFRATPVTIIDGEAVVGFDRAKLEKLLGLAWYPMVFAQDPQLANPGRFPHDAWAEHGSPHRQVYVSDDLQSKG
jgi:glutaredoxin 3